ncbi:MAG: hypothetical protein WB566_07475 [Terriglobales bacterium]
MNEDVMTPEMKLYRYLGCVADSIKDNNFFQADEDVAALKKLLKGQSSEAAVAIQKRFFDIADVVKKRQKEPALQRVRAAMTILEPLLP